MLNTSMPITYPYVNSSILREAQMSISSCVLESELEKYKILSSSSISSRISLDLNVSTIVGHKAALVFEKIRYWVTTTAGKIIQGRRWIYNTYKEWGDQLGFTARQVRYCIQKLEKRGLIESGMFNKKKSDRTKWYTLPLELFEKFNPFSNPKEKHLCKPQNSLKGCDKIVSPCDKIVASTTNRLTTKNNLNEKGSETLARSPLPSLEVSLQEDNFKDSSQGTKKASLSKTEATTYALEQIDILNEKLRVPLKVTDRTFFHNSFHKLLKKCVGSLSREKVVDYFRSYCRSIEGSTFLTGQVAMKNGNYFVLTLSSLLSARFFREWMEGEGYFRFSSEKNPSRIEGILFSKGGKEENTQEAAPSLPSFELSLDSIKRESKNTFDRKVKENIWSHLPPFIYYSWFYKPNFIAQESSNLLLSFSIEGDFHRDWIMTHYEELLKKAFGEAYKN